MRNQKVELFLMTKASPSLEDYRNWLAQINCEAANEAERRRALVNSIRGRAAARLAKGFDSTKELRRLREGA